MIEIIYDNNSKPIIIKNFEVTIIDKRCLDDKKYDIHIFGPYSAKLYVYNNEIEILKRYLIKCLLLEFDKNISSISNWVLNFIVIYNDEIFEIYDIMYKKLEFIKRLKNFSLIYIDNYNGFYTNICDNKCVKICDDKLIKVENKGYKKTGTTILFEEILEMLRSTIKPCVC